MQTQYIPYCNYIYRSYISNTRIAYNYAYINFSSTILIIVPLYHSYHTN